MKKSIYLPTEDYIGLDFTFFCIEDLKGRVFPPEGITLRDLNDSAVIRGNKWNEMQLVSNESGKYITEKEVELLLKLNTPELDGKMNTLSFVGLILSSEYKKALSTGMLYEWVPEATGSISNDLELFKVWVFKDEDLNIKILDRYLDDLEKGRLEIIKKGPKEGYPLRHNEPDPLNGITPEMREAAKPKLKGIDFKAPIIVDTLGSSCATKDMFMNPEKYKELQKIVFQWDELGQMPDYKNKKIADAPNKNSITLEDLEEAAGYIHKNSSPKIDLIIYQAEGYFVGEYVMEGRSGKTKAGWKGIKELVERYSPRDFKVTYNGVKYKVEDNKELFKKLFDE